MPQWKIICTVPTETSGIALRHATEQFGRSVVEGVAFVGRAFVLFIECVYWLIADPRWLKPVWRAAVASEMMSVGVSAAPVAAVMALSAGIMLSIQAVSSLQDFGAQSRAAAAIAVTMFREFGPLITAFLFAGRSASAVTVRLGTMQISQEIDALRVMGINPIHYLVTPVLIAMLVMVPCMTIFIDILAVLGGGIYCAFDLGMTLSSYAQYALAALVPFDAIQGLIKSVMFALLITLISATYGLSVQGGPAQVGAATTRAVVTATSAVVITDMVVTFLLAR